MAEDVLRPVTIPGEDLEAVLGPEGPESELGRIGRKLHLLVGERIEELNRGEAS